MPLSFQLRWQKVYTHPSYPLKFSYQSHIQQHFRKDIMAQATYVQTVNIGDGNANCGNITGSFNVYQSDEDVQILRWLSPLEPNNRHQGVRIDRFAGVGEWLLETTEFREWREPNGGEDKAILFCSGNPGVGKTYLSSLVIDSLCDQAKDEDIAVACLYCDFLSQQEQTSTNMMGAILKQLVGRGGIPKYLRVFEEGKKEIGGRGLLLPDLMRVLRITITSLPQVFICIDALDECLPKNLPELLESLRDIVRESPKTRIFLTGRPHAKEDIQRYFPKAVVMPVSPNTNDVRNYLEMRLSRDPEPDAMNDDLRADLVRIFLEKISDIFLLVSLNIDAILGGVTISQRRKKLEEMTRGNGLGDAYTATLNRVRAQKGDKSILGLKVLMWVAYSEHPLQALDLRHALGVELGSTDLDVENVPTLRTLLSSALGLVTVETSSSTVRPVHYTLQEYLSSDPTLFDSPHSTIAQVCLTYLNFRSVRGRSPILDLGPSIPPFLRYASYYWGDHARKGMTGDVKTLALRLLDGLEDHISGVLMLMHHALDSGRGPWLLWRKVRTGFTGLHGAAFLGIVDIVSAVLEMKEWDVNATDSSGRTALTWAAVRGQEEVVRMLLGRGDVNPDSADTRDGRTALSWASELGYGGVVKMLLERADVDPDQTDTKFGRTALSWAAGYGNEGVVQMLLERADVNPDHADSKYGRTPISWASEFGHAGVVMMLLERAEVNPDHADTKYGRTPLSWAAGEGQKGVIKLLLGRADVNPDQTDIEYGLTPLSSAAEFGHEEVVKMLLERGDVNPSHVDPQYGRTPLLWAAGFGHEGVVKMLLERADVNPNQPDLKHGRTALSWAAGYGKEGVVRMLLERGDVNPDHADSKYGRTPISWAAQYGSEGVIKVLLEQDNVNPNTVDTKYGRTPISWAAEYGREGVVRVLLEREDVNPNTAETKNGLTPLSWAAGRGHLGTVKLLLERKDVHNTISDNKSQVGTLQRP